MSNYHEGYGYTSQMTAGVEQYQEEPGYSSGNNHLHRRSGTPKRQRKIARGHERNGPRKRQPQNQQQNHNQHQHTQYPSASQAESSSRQQRNVPPQRVYQQHLVEQGYQEQREGTPKRAHQQRLMNGHNNQDQRQGSSPNTRYQQSLPPEYQYPTDLDQRMYQAQPRPSTAELREEDYNAHVLREREAEILEINKKMHTVKDIYQDLAGLIDGQQDLIDKIDESLEYANANVNAGVDDYNEARLRYENPIMEDPFGDRLQKKSKEKRKSRKKERNNMKRELKYDDEIQDLNCQAPFKTIKEDLKEVVNDMKSFVLACTAPDIHENEYAY